MNTLLVWLFAAFIAQVLLGTVLVRFCIKSSAKPNIYEVFPEDLGDRSLKYFENFRSQILECGFTFLKYCKWENKNSTYIALYKNLSTGEDAALLSTIGTAKVTNYIAFASEFEDLRKIETNNYEIQGIHYPLPKRKVFQFPESDHPLQLLRFHRKLVQKYVGDLQPRIVKDGEELESLKKSIVEEYQNQVDAGLYYIDSRQEFFYLTWKGAFCMTLKLTWPVKGIRNQWTRRKSRILARELDII